MSFKTILESQWVRNFGRVRGDIESLNAIRNNVTNPQELHSRYMSICSAGKIYSTDALTFLEAGKNIPFLIGELTGNAPHCALDMYHAYYANNNDKLLSYTDISNSPTLKHAYLAWGGDSVAFAGVTAMHWHLSEMC